MSKKKYIHRTLWYFSEEEIKEARLHVYNTYYLDTDGPDTDTPPPVEDAADIPDSVLEDVHFAYDVGDFLGIYDFTPDSNGFSNFDNLDAVDTLNPIIGFGTIKRWDGRRDCLKIVDENLGHAIYAMVQSLDDWCLYLEGMKLRLEGFHHDGDVQLEIRELSNAHADDGHYDFVGDLPFDKNAVRRYTKSLYRRLIEKLYV